MSKFMSSIGSALSSAVVSVKNAVSESVSELADAVRERILIADWVKEVNSITLAIVRHINERQAGAPRVENQANREVFTEIERFGAADVLNKMPNVEKYGNADDKYVAQEFCVLVGKDIPSIIDKGQSGLNRVVYRCGRIRAIVSPNEE